MNRRSDLIAFGRPDFGDEEAAAVIQTLRSGWVGMGEEVRAFESELAEYLQSPHVVTVNSCTAALHLSLAALEIGPGDEVICPSLTWCSSANAALYLGAKVVFADVDPRTFNLDPESVREKLTTRTRAVVVVHFGGLAADLRRLRAVVPEGVHIVEDAAHAFGARYPDGSPVGSSGAPTCFSFYANKNLSTAEGGAVALAEGSMADRLRRLRQHGMASDAWKRFIEARAALVAPIEELGFKANYTDLQASIGRVQLRRFASLQERRRAIACYYLDRLTDVRPALSFQELCHDEAHALHLFVVLLPIEELRISRNEVLLQLRDRNVGAAIHYSLLHMMPLYQRKLGYCQLPVTEDVGSRILTLPIGPTMTLTDAEYVCDQLIDVIDSASRYGVEVAEMKP